MASLSCRLPSTFSDQVLDLYRNLPNSASILSTKREGFMYDTLSLVEEVSQHDTQQNAEKNGDGETLVKVVVELRDDIRSRLRPRNMKINYCNK